jgi:hypothetical protein
MFGDDPDHAARPTVDVCAAVRMRSTIGIILSLITQNTERRKIPEPWPEQSRKLGALA